MSGASITITRRVAWMDTDAAGIWHWTAGFRYAEEAEAALHTELGIVDLTFGATPRLSVDAEFHSPVAFNDEIAITITIEHVGRTSMRNAFKIERVDDATLVADGHVSMCLIDRVSRRPTPWPEAARALLVTRGQVS